jgi:tetratricopeptide (TPR) repeat protein
LVQLVRRVLLVVVAGAILWIITAWPRGETSRTIVIAGLTLLLLAGFEWERRVRSRPRTVRRGRRTRDGSPHPTGPASVPRDVRTFAAEPIVVAPERILDGGDVSPSQATFCGRDAELAALLAQYRVAREQATGGKAGRPVLVPIHGKPGVGKSALAMELARRLAPEHSDGPYHVNLGNAGEPHSAGEILGILLRLLGWSEKLGSDSSDRARVFRTLTGDRRALFVFEAARDHRQVLDALPANSECTVIVTSRPDLSAGLGTQSWLLTEPSTDDALDILHAIAETSHYSSPLCAATIIERCGHLPLAIQSAAERISREGAEICGVAAMLESPDTRLARLTYSGRNPRRVFQTQYSLLNEVEREAFALLSLVPSRTFVSWLLDPLLDVTVKEAESIMARLAVAQLVEAIDGDAASGPARYRMHTLVRLFAAETLQAQVGDYTRARDRLRKAYQWIVSEVIALQTRDVSLRRFPDVRIREEVGWHPANVIAEDPYTWVRAEHRNLVQCVKDFFADRQWSLCWRTAVWLGECLPEDGDIQPALQALHLGLQAARTDGDQLGQADVHLATASLLVWSERYPEAFQSLSEASALARSWRVRQPARAARGKHREAVAELKFVESYLQMQAPVGATKHLQNARKLLADAGHSDAAKLLRIFQDLKVQIRSDDVDLDVTTLGNNHYAFWALIRSAEYCRWRQQWDEAAELFQRAAACCPDDAGRSANVSYRTARLLLNQLDRIGTGDEELARRAVRRATDAVLLYQRMSNRLGELRARCILARALVAAHEFTCAEEQIVAARDLAESGVDDPPEAVRAIRARINWAYGTLLMHSPDGVPAAREALFAAALLLDGLEDTRAAAGVRRTIEAAQRVPRPSETRRTEDGERLGATLPHQRGGPATARSAEPPDPAVDRKSAATALRRLKESTLPSAIWRSFEEMLPPRDESDPREVVSVLSSVERMSRGRGRYIMRIGAYPTAIPPQLGRDVDEWIAKLVEQRIRSDAGDDSNVDPQQS